MIEDTMATWHKIVEEKETGLLEGILADDVVFHSPVVHTPQEGKPITLLYLTAAAEVLGGEGFRYVRKVIDDRNAILEFETEIDGIHINGVDMIRWNEQGLIDDFKVMVRPLKAINLLHRMMGEMLASMSK